MITLTNKKKVIMIKSLSPHGQYFVSNTSYHSCLLDFHPFFANIFQFLHSFFKLHQLLKMFSSGNFKNHWQIFSVRHSVVVGGFWGVFRIVKMLLNNIIFFFILSFLFADTTVQNLWCIIESILPLSCASGCNTSHPPICLTVKEIIRFI